MAALENYQPKISEFYRILSGTPEQSHFTTLFKTDVLMTVVLWMKINGSEWNINVFLLIAAYVENEKKNLRRELAQNFLWRVEKVKVFSFWMKKV